MHVQAAGVLIPVKCESGLQVSHDEYRSEFVSINGARTQFVAPRVNRAWVASFDVARPHELATLHALRGGEYGPGPFRLIDSWAQVTNALDARTSLLEPWVGSANLSTVIRPTADAAPVGRSIVNLASGVNLTPGVAYFAPAPPAGRKVTVSAYAWGAGLVTIRPVWGHPDGTTSNGTMSGGQSVPGDGSLGRIHATETVHEAVGGKPVSSVGVAVYGATYAARPCVTWTDQVHEWAVGESPRHVTIDAATYDILHAWHGADANRHASLSVTFREVGP